jgi:hypothetical protein
MTVQSCSTISAAWTDPGVSAVRYADRVSADHALSGFKLIEVSEPAVLASMARIDAMSDDEIRELARGEPDIVVSAAEGIIADRHKGQTGPTQDR